MRKKYLAPTSTCIPVSVQLLAGSVRRIEGANGLNWGGGTTQNDITMGNARSSDFWDDVDPEDYDEEELD